MRPLSRHGGAVALHWIALGVCLAAVLGAACHPADPESSGDAWLEIRGRRVELEVARTREQQTRGLGYRDELAWDHGMLFPYEKAFFPRFWMKGMRFDIDIVWIRDQRVVDISHRVRHQPPGEPLPTVSPDQLTNTVLEVPAGYAQAHGWQVGDFVRYAEGVPR